MKVVVGPMSLPTVLVVVLSLLAVSQVGFLTSRVLPDANRVDAVRPVGIGDDLSELRTRPLESSLGQLRIGRRPMLLPVFHPDCRWSDSVSASWAAWMSTDLPYDVVALTHDAPGSARRFVRDNGWQAPTHLLLPSIDDGDHGWEARTAARTPWMFGADAAGRVAYQGHGRSVCQPSHTTSCSKANTYPL